MKTPVTQSDLTFEEMNRIIWQHLVARDWTNGHPRSFAISIALEASELLEHYQWTDTPVGNKQDLADELADILIYAFEFAQATDIDIPKAMQDKLAKAAEKFKNKSKEAMQEAWIQVKTTYKKEGL